MAPQPDVAPEKPPLTRIKRGPPTKSKFITKRNESTTPNQDKLNRMLQVSSLHRGNKVNRCLQDMNLRNLDNLVTSDTPKNARRYISSSSDEEDLSQRAAREKRARDIYPEMKKLRKEQKRVFSRPDAMVNFRFV